MRLKTNYGLLQKSITVFYLLVRIPFGIRIIPYFWQNFIIMKLAVVGVSGLVGKIILEVLEEFQIQIDEFLPVASSKSVGKGIQFKGKNHKIIGIDEAIKQTPDVAIFSAGSDVSLTYAPQFAELGCHVIDNSSAWRMSPDHKLIVPEINGDSLLPDDLIIANPNCSTIQMVLALNPLHIAYGIKRIVVSTYQSVTGTGKAAVDQLMDERGNVDDVRMVYPHPIDMNALPHIDVFMENGYTKEEMKMVNETHKILGDKSIAVTATAVRLPVRGGHSESVNVEFHNDFELSKVFDLLRDAEGIAVVDDPEKNIYPMPIDSEGKNEVFVGRIRRDESNDKTLNLWIVADNLRKGAATNTVQIVQHLLNKGFIS